MKPYCMLYPNLAFEQIHETTQVYTFNSQTYQIGGITLLALILIIVYLLIRLRRVKQELKKEIKIAALMAEKLHFCLELNKSLEKSYKEMHQKLQDDDGYD